MTTLTGNTTPHIEQAEHENSVGPATKRVLAYGFDGSAKQIIKVNDDGRLEVISGVTYDTQMFDNSGETTFVITYKVGGTGGTTVKTKTINYTDSTKIVVSSIVET